ncbi:MAG: DNA polymerase III subunit epsilon [Candidatus Marinimicrobia bacterium]|jgi:DNA polymerase-3 subunit epsilon|nr:DNA polymerase III subunit epsilon [Candidatus Neomarinimicrobiota bacterium]MBT3944513.1 DNA polymerase III subunit epsilon [Candidatus Neomarinimicrobiota bacterium]MBT4111968.1 DNA polymerase III subunit epsilon [Candidatus Neomarinimicrobiota bacterium]MBT4316730.1 DNA polymerase III subunit epsilon [Candidatus Neomarinimicrobiota bacterium]MBT4706329.1 DNA polymerase III subunit epsilon [Candidatus Neomarinimicrobiota bacterium]
MGFLNKIIDGDKKIELYKFEGESFTSLPKDYHNDNAVKVCFLDLETTGLQKDCKIIEFAGKITAIDKNSGELLGIVDEYESFNDPEEALDPVITRITGLTDDTIAGHSIDWEAVSRILNSADIIIAHNAFFDRGVMDRHLPLSQDKVWACSVNDINWTERGFSARGQEILCIWHGFYYDSHRAMFDVDALIHLITHDIEGSDNAVLELLVNAAMPIYKIAAIGSPFHTKDLLRLRKYRWDPENKYWWKNISLDEIDIEKEWMADTIYNGHFQGKVDEISITDKYKS